MNNGYRFGGSGVDGKAASDRVHATQANSAATGTAAQSWGTTAVEYRAGREEFGVFCDFAEYDRNLDKGIYISGKRGSIQCLGTPTGGWATGAALCKGVQALSNPYCR